MSDDLYNAQIVAVARSKAGAGRLPHPDVTVTCDNPLCGDRVTIDLVTSDGRIGAIAQHTRGCLLTQAAAAVIARHAVGTDAALLARVAAQMTAMLGSGNATTDLEWPELAMFAPVSTVRSRHDCVLLPFRAVEEALAGAGKLTS